MKAALFTVLRHRLWQISLVLVTLGIVLFFNSFDLTIAEYFHHYRGTLFYDTFKIVTRAGDGHWYLVPSLLLYIIWRKRHALRAKAALFLFTTVAASGIIVNIIKPILGRARPTLYFKEELYGFEWFHLEAAMRSFPSGHSATAIGAWLALALIFPKYRLPLLAVGALLASSRVFVGAHYVSDVFAGGFLGATVTLILYYRFFHSTTGKVVSHAPEY